MSFTVDSGALGGSNGGDMDEPLKPHPSAQLRKGIHPLNFARGDWRGRLRSAEGWTRRDSTNSPKPTGAPLNRSSIVNASATWPPTSKPLPSLCWTVLQPERSQGVHKTQSLLLRAEAGTGKTWSAIQLTNELAEAALQCAIAGCTPRVPVLSTCRFRVLHVSAVDLLCCGVTRARTSLFLRLSCRRRAESHMELSIVAATSRTCCS